MSHLDSWRGSWSYSWGFHGGTSQQCSVGLLQSEDELVKPTLERNRLLLGSRDGNPDTPNLDENIIPNIKYLQVSPLKKKTSPKRKSGIIFPQLRLSIIITDFFMHFPRLSRPLPLRLQPRPPPPPCHLCRRCHKCPPPSF